MEITLSILFFFKKINDLIIEINKIAKLIGILRKFLFISGKNLEIYCVNKCPLSMLPRSNLPLSVKYLILLN